MKLISILCRHQPVPQERPLGLAEEFFLKLIDEEVFHGWCAFAGLGFVMLNLLIILNLWRFDECGSVCIAEHLTTPCSNENILEFDEYKNLFHKYKATKEELKQINHQAFLYFTEDLKDHYQPIIATFKLEVSKLEKEFLIQKNFWDPCILKNQELIDLFVGEKQAKYYKIIVAEIVVVISCGLRIMMYRDFTAEEAGIIRWGTLNLLIAVLLCSILSYFIRDVLELELPQMTFSPN